MKWKGKGCVLELQQGAAAGRGGRRGQECGRRRRMEVESDDDFSKGGAGVETGLGVFVKKKEEEKRLDESRAGAASRACQARVLPANAGVHRGIVYWAECRRDGLRSRSERKATTPDVCKATRLAFKALIYRTRHTQHPLPPASTNAGAHRQALIISLHTALMTPYTHGT